MKPEKLIEAMALSQALYIMSIDGTSVNKEGARLASDYLLELSREVRKVQDVLTDKKNQRDVLQKDYQYAYQNDLRARENELMDRIRVLDIEIKLLETLTGENE